MGREWAPIPSAPGLEASSDGQVRSVRRVVPRLLKVYPDDLGYFHFRPRVGNKQSWRSVHSAVAEAHIGPRPEGAHIRHLDGNPSNNLLVNLAYGTPSENTFDQVRHGTHANARKTHCRRGHAYDEANTYRRGRSRYCRACNRAAVARRKARKKDEL